MKRWLIWTLSIGFVVGVASSLINANRAFLLGVDQAAVSGEQVAAQIGEAVGGGIGTALLFAATGYVVVLIVRGTKLLFRRSVV